MPFSRCQLSTAASLALPSVQLALADLWSYRSEYMLPSLDSIDAQCCTMCHSSCILTCALRMSTSTPCVLETFGYSARPTRDGSATLL